MTKLNRRKFLNFGLRGTAAATLARFCEINAYAASANTSYKALVCILLDGGNDCHNTVIPINTSLQGYSAYSQYRTPASGTNIPQAKLHAILAGKDQYGLHTSLTNIANMYGNTNSPPARAAILANVGNLVTPTTQSEYLNWSEEDPAYLPDALFSHSDQVQQWLSATPNDFATTGWAGRIGDVLLSEFGPPKLPINITAASQGGIFGTGVKTAATSLNGFDPVNSPNTPPMTVSTTLLSSLGLSGYNALFKFSNGLQLVQASNALNAQGITDHATLLSAVNATDAGWTSEINSVLPYSNDPVLSQFRLVAQLIAATGATSSQLGINNQIFFIRQGPYDTHSAELGSSPLSQDSLLAALDAAVFKFYTVLANIGLAKQVVAFTNSEFGRTLLPNANLGTDHAWGGHHFIISGNGGPVSGGNMFGTFPTLQVGGPDDVTNNAANTRGVTIPTTSVVQYAATLAAWFGVSQANMPAVLPAATEAAIAYGLPALPTTPIQGAGGIQLLTGA